MRPLRAFTELALESVTSEPSLELARLDRILNILDAVVPPPSAADVAMILRGRPCARLGCRGYVSKPTAKYCSVRCCSVDPARLDRLRADAAAAKRSALPTVLPMVRQLELPLMWTESDGVVERSAHELATHTAQGIRRRAMAWPDELDDAGICGH